MSSLLFRIYIGTTTLPPLGTQGIPSLVVGSTKYNKILNQNVIDYKIVYICNKDYCGHLVHSNHINVI